jgi:hypothetical protein
LQRVEGKPMKGQQTCVPAGMQSPERALARNGLVTEFINPASDTRWDSFVESHPYGWLTHLSSWQRILEASFSHMQGYYPALVHPGTGEIRAALPIFEVRSWLTGRKLVSIPWATFSDPLVTSREDFDLLAREVQKLREKLGADHVEIRALHTSGLLDEGEPVNRPNFKHHYLRLHQDINGLMGSFHRSCVQQRIKRAQDCGLTLRIGDSIEQVKIMYAMHLKNRKSKGLPPQPFLLYQNIWKILYPQKKVSLFIAEYRGEPIATLLLFKFKDRVSAEVAQIDENFRSMSPNIFLFWEAIKQAVQEGYQIFDFGRTSPSNQTLVDFKSRWGTNVSDIYFFYNPIEKTQGLVDTYSQRYRFINMVCKYTPEFVQPYIGQFCYRHTG